MSIALQAKRRFDVNVFEFQGQESWLLESKLPEIFERLYSTCVDLSEARITTPSGLVETSLYSAGMEKYGRSHKEVQEEQARAWKLDTGGRQAKVVLNPFGDVKHLSSVTTLAGFMKMRVAYSDDELAFLNQDLMRRSSSDQLSSTRLLKYNSVLFGGNLDDLPQNRRHAYLFHDSLVFASDGPTGFTSIPLDSQLCHPLTIIRKIDIRTVKDVVPGFSAARSAYIFDLTLLFDDPLEPPLTIGLYGLATTSAWAMIISKLRLFGGRLPSDARETQQADVVAFATVAKVLHKLHWHLPITQSLGDLILHDEAIIKDNKHFKTCGVVLFQNVLLFLHGAPPKVLRHFVVSRIRRVYDVPKNGWSVGLTHTTEYGDYLLQEEVVFTFNSATQVRTWRERLRDVAPNAEFDNNIDWDAPRSTKPRKSIAEPVSSEQSAGNTSHFAGLTILLSTAVPSEYNICVAVHPQYESDGLATHGVAHVLDLAFTKFGAHRVQARVVHSTSNPEQTARAVRKFIHLGFSHEGVRRGAVMHPTERVWADVSVLSMLELDWHVRDGVHPPDGTLWDEMFGRHQRERESLLRMEGALKRTKSSETIRDMRELTQTAPTSGMASSGVAPSLTSRSDSARSDATETSSLLSGAWEAVSEPSSVASFSSTISLSAISTLSSGADDAADEDAEWALEEDHSDEEIESDS
ncbi:hypothetical protein BKA62DRAFT_642031 [Auriculariales sp. MPI-PUGE-AT-0066]|nr:hypothetical protein BKA62DRAFT_642031 [Auriculariales sp. MPI-PUGE-AT-0066]